jgi:hypothetical protein
MQVALSTEQLEKERHDLLKAYFNQSVTISSLQMNSTLFRFHLHLLLLFCRCFQCQSVLSLLTCRTAVPNWANRRGWTTAARRSSTVWLMGLADGIASMGSLGGLYIYIYIFRVVVIFFKNF